MTNRNRTTRSRNQPRRRIGRNVWINNSFNATLVNDGLAQVNLTSIAESFMTFDTTVVQVIIPVFNYAVLTDATVGTREIRYALIVAPTNMDSTDHDTLFSDSQGQPYMFVGGDSFRTGAIGQLNLSLVLANGGPIISKAKRRFRENDSDVFLLLDNEFEAGDSSLTVTGYSRVLIHIP